MEEVVYDKKHLLTLKRYGYAKIMFLLMGCLTLLLQSLAWVVVLFKEVPVSTSSKVFVTITQIGSLLFIISQFALAIRNKHIIKTIITSGKCTTRRLKVKVSNKASFAGGLLVLCRIIAVIFVILLGILVVNFLQNYLNWGKVILKMPIMILLAVEFLNSSAELKFKALLERC